MNLKKWFFAVCFMMTVAFSGYAQISKSVGAMVSYNPFDPTFMSGGIMLNLGNYEDFGYGYRLGVSLGRTTVTYEERSPFYSGEPMTEYWQKSYYADLIGGVFGNIGLSDTLAFRIGGDIVLTYAPANKLPDAGEEGILPAESDIGMTVALGLVLFPKKDYSIIIEGGGELLFGSLSFVMPLRLMVCLNY